MGAVRLMQKHVFGCKDQQLPHSKMRTRCVMSCCVRKSDHYSGSLRRSIDDGLLHI